MELKIDLNKEYALCLEGGGAKGAYQIGAWHALREVGMKINAVAGTSVGALNAALICMGDLERAEDIWSHISHSRVMEVEQEKADLLFSQEGTLLDWIHAVLKYTVEGGADITPLKELIADFIDEEKIKTGNIAFFLHTFCRTDKKELDVDVRELEDGLLPDYLLASAYLPVFKQEKLHGKSYMDPGMFNNVPLDSLIKRGYQDIILLRIFGLGRYKPVEIPEGVHISSIQPRVNLGNMLNFNSRQSVKNLRTGYFDAKRYLYGLAGKMYYIDESEKECDYVKRLININIEVMQYVNEAYAPKQEGSVYRIYFEHTLGVIAETLKLKAYDYKDLYLFMVEQAARLCKLPRYHIYKIEEMITAIKERWEQKDIAPAFLAVLLNQLPVGEVNQESVTESRNQ
ncbi:MAG: patatin-like phospholipase family protein [Lachnospiraceae bacterium]|nr:patatin-like phospholipase family protein [Lachnospiraceae bacterium]